MSRTLSAIAALLLTACAAAPDVYPEPANPLAQIVAITEPDWRTPDPQNILVIDTNRGRLLVELVPEAAPGHVERVRQLAREGVYDGRTFFRVIDRFMAQ